MRRRHFLLAMAFTLVLSDAVDPGVFHRPDLYRGFENGGTVNPALTYEFGRNFKFYSPQLAY